MDKDNLNKYSSFLEPHVAVMFIHEPIVFKMVLFIKNNVSKKLALFACIFLIPNQETHNVPYSILIIIVVPTALCKHVDQDPFSKYDIG